MGNISEGGVYPVRELQLRQLSGVGGREFAGYPSKTQDYTENYTGAKRFRVCLAIAGREYHVEVSVPGISIVSQPD